MLSAPATSARKAEITADFHRLVDEHIMALLSGKAERRFHPSDFGKLLFIHPRHLTNTIIETTGISPCEIMENRVMAEAKRLLTTTSLSVAHIASRFAFNDASNFTKFFKSMCGETPMRFRKNGVR